MPEHTIEIARDGDVILVATGVSTVTKFKVKSAVLRTSSRVFSAMLSPNFAEGKALQTTSDACEIQLQGDDPQVLGLALVVIHDQNEALPETLDDTNSIIDVAHIIDKYLLHEAMKSTMSRWLAQEDHVTQLLVAIILKDHDLFREISKAMVFHEALSYSKVYHNDEYEMLIHCLVNIDKTRNLVRASIPEEVHAVALELDSNPNPCPRAYYHAGLILRKLYNLDTKKNQTLQDTFDETAEALTEVIRPPHNYLCFDKAAKCLMSEMQERCKAQVTNIRDSFTGLCLYCETLKFDGETSICAEGHSV